MIGANIERFETEDAVIFRISWYDGKEHREKWIEKVKSNGEVDCDD